MTSRALMNEMDWIGNGEFGFIDSRFNKSLNFKKNSGTRKRGIEQPMSISPSGKYVFNGKEPKENAVAVGRKL